MDIMGGFNIAMLAGMHQIALKRKNPIIFSALMATVRK
jgi:hypothetical protein